MSLIISTLLASKIFERGRVSAIYPGKGLFWKMPRRRVKSRERALGRPARALAGAHLLEAACAAEQRGAVRTKDGRRPGVGQLERHRLQRTEESIARRPDCRRRRAARSGGRRRRRLVA